MLIIFKFYKINHIFKTSNKIQTLKLFQKKLSNNQK